MKPTDAHFQCKFCTHEHLLSRMVGFAKFIGVVMMIFHILIFLHDVHPNAFQSEEKGLGWPTFLRQKNILCFTLEINF